MNPIRSLLRIGAILVLMALCPQQAHADAPKPGVGLSFAEIGNAFPEFYFREAPLDTGEARWIGETMDGLAVIEIIGEMDDASQVTLTVDYTEEALLFRNLALLAGLIKLVLPDCTECDEWFKESLGKMQPGETTTSETSFNARRLKIEMIPDVSITLTVGAAGQ